MLAGGTSDSWHANGDPVHYWLVVLKYPLMLVVGLGASAILTWQRKRKNEIAEGWPSVEGTIQFVDVSPIFDTTNFRATLTYSYFAGEYRSGKFTQDFYSEESANKFAQPMKDKKVPIHYNPKDPDKSVLEDADVGVYLEQQPGPQIPVRLV
jgi:hypothetical protein